MSTLEGNVFPVITHLHVRKHDREVTSMSDYVHTGRNATRFTEQGSNESRLLFCACYLLFLSVAIVKRLMPRRKSAVTQSGARETIFREASSAASILVGSSFMGL